MTYKIGQLLFIVSNSTKTIEPIQVTSKQTLEDLAGTTIQHMCCGVSGKTFTLEAHIEDQKLAGVFGSDGDPLENVKDGQTIILEDGTQARIHLPGEIL